jgi:hypothetical protein
MGAAAIGIVPHTGWAWLVRVSGTIDAAEVEARERLVACDVLDGELYHRAAERARGAAGFLDKRRAAAVIQARRALAPHAAGVGAAIVVGKQAALPPLEQIVASHALIHGAEGELWRAIFAEACGAGGLAAVRATAEDLRAALARLRGAAAVAAFLAAGKRRVGAPWSREVQDAALAAWSALDAATLGRAP